MPGPVTSSSPRAYDLNPVSSSGTEAPECKLSDSASASEPLADAETVSQLTAKYRQDYSAFLTAQTQTPTPTSVATVDNTRRELPTAIRYAELAHAAYGSAAVPGWHRLDAAELEAARRDPGAFEASARRVRRVCDARRRVVRVRGVCALDVFAGSYWGSVS